MKFLEYALRTKFIVQEQKLARQRMKRTKQSKEKRLVHGRRFVQESWTQGEGCRKIRNSYQMITSNDSENTTER